MAIRVTFSYSGYVAQTLVSSVVIRVGSTRCFQECWTWSRIFCPGQERPDFDPSPPCGGHNYHSDFRPPKSSCWAKNSASTYTTFAAGILGDNSKNPFILGLISMMRSTVGVSGSCASRTAVCGISPWKVTSIIPVLQGSKWLPCPFPFLQAFWWIKVEHVVLAGKIMRSPGTAPRILRRQAGFRVCYVSVQKMRKLCSLLSLLVFSSDRSWLNRDRFPHPQCSQL